jgi:hypothetical protein
MLLVASTVSILESHSLGSSMLMHARVEDGVMMADMSQELPPGTLALDEPKNIHDQAFLAWAQGSAISLGSVDLANFSNPIFFNFKVIVTHIIQWIVFFFLFSVPFFSSFFQPPNSPFHSCEESKQPMISKKVKSCSQCQGARVTRV